MRIKITSPDKAIHALVSALLSKASTSVMASNRTALFHLVNGRISEKIMVQIEELGAVVEYV